MGRKPKVTDQMRWTVNYLYHHTNLKISACGRHVGISPTTAAKLIVGRDEWEKMNEEREVAHSSTPELSYLNRDDALEFMRLFPGAIDWLRERSYWRQLEYFEDRAKKVPLGEHEQQWADEMRAFLKDKTPPPKEQET